MTAERRGDRELPAKATPESMTIGIPSVVPLIAARGRATHASLMSDVLTLTDKGYFSARGLDVLVFSNRYDANFGDAKLSGVEIIHHGVRTATNGDIRLHPTPEQWDAIPKFETRRVDEATNVIEASLGYPDYAFFYRIRVRPRDKGFQIAVELKKPLPPALEGRAGFNLEFLPAAYFGKSYFLDDTCGTLPLHPAGPMIRGSSGETHPSPIATGRVLTLAPEDPKRRVLIESHGLELALFDGRNKAQNGWFVVRTLIPAATTGEVVCWTLEAGRVPGWIRRPVIAHSQLGYHPLARKQAVIELDPNDTPRPFAALVRITPDGEREALKAKTHLWGDYLRYTYLIFDFSSVQEPGVYALTYGDERTAPFHIAEDIYRESWHPTLDVFLPVQMDHMLVREAYRVWHGAAHLDDATQAPVNHAHFDLYAQGPTTDTPFDSRGTHSGAG